MVDRLKVNPVGLEHLSWCEPRYGQPNQAEPTQSYVGALPRFLVVCRERKTESPAYDLAKPGERYPGPWIKFLPTRSEAGHGGVPRASRGRDMSPPYPLTRAARGSSARRAEHPVRGRGDRGDQR